MIFLLPVLVGWHSTSVGVLWAVISTVFVHKDTRTHSLSAGISRLIATFVGFALCLIYLLLLPATTIGMGALIAVGVLLMIISGRRDETGLTARGCSHCCARDFDWRCVQMGRFIRRC